MSSYESWSVWGTWVSAIATFLATIAALLIGLKEIIWKWLFPVRIHIGWANREPYAQITTHRNGMTRPEEVMFRIELVNNGKTDAQDVEIVLESLERKTSEDIGPITGSPWHALPGFVPVSLKWTHLNQARLDLFPSAACRYVDFGLWQWFQTSPHPTLSLSTEVGLKMGGSTLTYGKYRFQIVITCRGGMVYRACWSFGFEDNDARRAQPGIEFIGFNMQLEEVLFKN